MSGTDSPEPEPDFEVTAIMATSPSLGGLFPTLAVTWERKAHERVGSFLYELRQAARVQGEEVEQRMIAGDRYSEFLEDLVRKAVRDTNRDHARALGRVAAAAWSGDDASIDDAAIVTDAITALRPAHVRVLVKLAEALDRYGPGPELGIMEPSSGRLQLDNRELAEALKSDRGLVTSLASQLDALGLIENILLGQNPGGIAPSGVRWMLSDLGRRVLQALDGLA